MASEKKKYYERATTKYLSWINENDHELMNFIITDPPKARTTNTCAIISNTYRKRTPLIDYSLQTLLGIAIPAYIIGYYIG